jgi:hypothetical protein
MEENLMMSSGLQDVITAEMLQENASIPFGKFSYLLERQNVSCECDIQAAHNNGLSFKVTLCVPLSTALEVVTSLKKIDIKSCKATFEEDKNLIPVGALLRAASFEKSSLGLDLLSLEFELSHTVA